MESFDVQTLRAQASIPRDMLTLFQRGKPAGVLGENPDFLLDQALFPHTAPEFALVVCRRFLDHGQSMVYYM